MGETAAYAQAGTVTSWQGARVQAQQTSDGLLRASIIALQACCEAKREDRPEFLHQAEDALRKLSPSFVDSIHDEQIGLRKR